jgi:hypothetical protein
MGGICHYHQSATEVHDSIEGVSRGSMRVVMYIFFKYIHAIGTRWMLDSLIAQIVVSSLELEGRRRRTRELGGRVALCASLFALLLPELGSGMTTACRVDAWFTLSTYLRQISRPDVWDMEIFLYRCEKMNTERCAGLATTVTALVLDWGFLLALPSSFNPLYTLTCLCDIVEHALGKESLILTFSFFFVPGPLDD